MADGAAGDLGGMSSAEHLDHAHRHTKAAGQHADLAATHLAAAIGNSDDSGGGDDGTDGGGGDRGMPVVASPPQAGYAQNRTSFSAGSGAARAYRAATGRRG